MNSNNNAYSFKTQKQMQIARFGELLLIVFNSIKFAFSTVFWLKQCLDFIKVYDAAEAHCGCQAVVPSVTCMH